MTLNDCEDMSLKCFNYFSEECRKVGAGGYSWQKCIHVDVFKWIIVKMLRTRVENTLENYLPSFIRCFTRKFKWNIKNKVNYIQYLHFWNTFSYSRLTLVIHVGQWNLVLRDHLVKSCGDNLDLKINKRFLLLIKSDEKWP